METIKTLHGMRQSILDRGDGRELASVDDERLLDVIDGLIADTDRRTTESRTEYVLNDDPPPGGWRFCTSWFREDGTLDKLFSDAPPNDSPYKHNYRFVNYRPVRQTRMVTKWG